MMNKITIFLSHSHKDIEKVRKIRDILETLECEPLIFFLKCLDDKNEELEEFIKEEINARSIFVYCKSSNSESSAWVKKELDYIKSFDTKRLYSIDIENDFSMGLITFLQQIATILKHNRIFISYSHRDLETADIITKYLTKNGYQITYDSELRIRGDWNHNKLKLIDNALEEGTFIFVASQNSLKSASCLDELYYAFSKKGRIIPIIIRDETKNDIYSQLPYEFHNMIHHIIHKNPTENELKNLIQHLNNI